MFTAFMASSAAALFGCADFLGGLASRRASALPVTVLSQVAGLPLLAVGLALLADTRPYQADLLWGLGAGIGGGIGIASLYAALAWGRMGVVAPVTAALAGAVPAAFDMVTGSALNPSALLGIALALLAIVIVSSIPAEAEPVHEYRSQRALALSVLAGLGFATSLLCLSFTSAESGMWPIAAARAISIPMIAAFTLARHRTVTVSRDAFPSALGAGGLDMAANFAIVTALRSGPLAVASVLGSLYPVATVLLARFVLGERLHMRQRFGMALALAAVVLTALP